MNDQLPTSPGHSFRFARPYLKPENAHPPICIQTAPGVFKYQADVTNSTYDDFYLIEPPSENTIQIWTFMICLFGGWWPLIALYLAHRERKLAIMYFETNDIALGNMSSKKSHLRMKWTYVSFVIGFVLMQMAYIVFMNFMMEQSQQRSAD